MRACGPLSLDMNCSDITKLYKQVVLDVDHDIPGAKQEMEAFSYIHITFPKATDE